MTRSPCSSAYTFGHSKTRAGWRSLTTHHLSLHQASRRGNGYLRLGGSDFFMHLYQADLTDVNLSLCEPIPNQLVLGQWAHIERLNLNFL